MGKKRKAYLHVGMPGVADGIEAALVHHRRALIELGVDVPAATSREAFRAAVEMTRDHANWDLRRKDVEGTWAGLCERVQRGRSSVVFSHHLLATATGPQIDLVLDALAGFDVHVVVTATAPDAWCVPGEPESDLRVLLDRWSAAVRKPNRVHVILVDAADAQAMTRQAWKAIGRLVGFGTASLGLTDVPAPIAARPSWLARTVPQERVTVLAAIARAWVEHLAAGGYDVIGDPDDVLAVGRPVTPEEVRLTDLDTALHDALREVERLTRRNEGLEADLEAADRKRRKLKRRLHSVA